MSVALPQVDDDLQYRLLFLSRELHGSPVVHGNSSTSHSLPIFLKSKKIQQVIDIKKTYDTSVSENKITPYPLLFPMPYSSTSAHSHILVPGQPPPTPPPPRP